MRERYGKLFTKAQELAGIYDDKFYPGLVGKTGKMNVYIKSSVFEFEDFNGGRIKFLEMLDLCNQLEILVDHDGKLKLVLTIEED